MKYKLPLIALMLTMLSSAFMQSTEAFTLIETSSYNGVDGTNYYANAVLTDTSGSVVEKSTAAQDTSTNFSIGSSDGSLVYIGFEEPFDGFAMDVATSASGGSYKVSYWDGTTWKGLTGTTSGSISNSGGTFDISWDRPSAWEDRTITIDVNEDGDEDSTESLYFVKFEITSDYSSSAKISQVGILDYNLVVTAEDEFGDNLSLSESQFEFTSTANETVYAFEDAGNKYYFALRAFDNPYSVAVSKTGFVTENYSKTLNQSQTSITTDLKYAYIATVKNSSGSYISDATVKMGEDYTINCDYVSSGEYACPTPYTESSDIRITKSGYSTHYSNFSTTRDSNSDNQVTGTFTLSTGSSSNDDTDLRVTDLQMDDDDLIVDVENDGDEDANDDAYLYIYVDDDHVASYFIDEKYLEGNETFTVTFTSIDELEDLDEEVEVEACIDPSDDVDEDDESNNCRTEDFGDDNNDDGIDFEVEDIYIDDDDDLIYTIANNGDEDAHGSMEIYVYVEQDGDEDSISTKTFSSSSSSYDFFDAGEEDDVNLGNVIDDYLEDNDDFDVTVCVDNDDDFDEEDEDNNCMTVDDSELDQGSGGDACGSFNDIDDHWAVDYICNLYDRDVVKGRTNSKYYPNEDVTRAEFLKMVLLGLDYDVEEKSGVHYTDVDDDDWFYEYVTYATAHDIVDGYEDGTFRPNDDISRAEAIVMVLKAADEEDYTYDEEDIEFWDVDESDWYAWAVVVADEANIISGYSDDSFKPESDISRGEAAKIVDLSYEEYEQ